MPSSFMVVFGFGAAPKKFLGQNDKGGGKRFDEVFLADPFDAPVNG